MKRFQEAKMQCIAMCYGDRLEKRFVTGCKGRLVYVSASSENSKPCSGVGFPKEAVFAFDQNLFAQIMEAQKAGDLAEIGKLKKLLTPLSERRA